jgi:hypothetical protein
MTSPLLRPLTASDAARVRAHLREILDSAAFRTSKRSQEFLGFVVEHTLSGAEEPLKERTIGVELFGRDVAYNTDEDSIVRVRANDIRKRLAQYYGQPLADQTLRIELPPGAYTPEFRIPDATAAPEPDLIVPPAPTENPRLARLWKAIAGVVVLALAGTVAVVLANSRSAVERFWGPMLSGTEPILFHLGQTVVYQLSRRVQDDYLRSNPELLRSLDVYQVPIRPDTRLTAEDVFPVRGMYVATGDATTIASIGSLLRQFKRPYQLKFSGALDAGEGNARMAILIGGFSNAWAISATRDLRFRYGRALTKDGAVWMIEDTGAGRKWQLVNVFPSQDTRVDYALITRLVDRGRGTMKVALGGITQFGTEAAAQMITEPWGLEQIAAAAPKDWAERNLQIVIQTRVVDRAAVSPKVLAVHSW